MGKKIRTYKGRMLDMDELKMKNQTTIAVGNNNVNARGDQLDEWGNIIKPRDQVAREKNTSTVRHNTSASVISSFEDDDDYEIVDDPNVVKSNKTKQTSTSTSKQKTETKIEPTPKAEDTTADETDLD